MLHVCGSFQQVVAAEGDVHRSRMPERPFVLVGQQYLADPSRSRDDVHPVWTYAHVPNARTGDVTDLILDQLERFAPGTRDRVLATHVTTPAQFATYNPNYVGGDVVTGPNDPLQVDFRPRPALDPYALGIPGAYLCSAATPPGAGVHGMCGARRAHHGWYRDRGGHGVGRRARHRALRTRRPGARRMTSAPPAAELLTPRDELVDRRVQRYVTESHARRTSVPACGHRCTSALTTTLLAGGDGPRLAVAEGGVGRTRSTVQGEGERCPRATRREASMRSGAASHHANGPASPDADVLHLVLERVEPVRDEFVQDLFERSVRDISELHLLDHRLRQLLRASIEENVVTALHVLAHDIDPHSLDAPTAAITYAERLAQNEIPLSALLRNYRIGLADFLQLAMTLAVEVPGGNDPALLMQVVQRASAYVDNVSERVTVAYEQERERWMQRRSALLGQRVTRVLEDPDRDIGDAERVLGYRLHQLHVAVVVWTDTDQGVGAASAADSLANRLGQLVGATSPPLVVPADDREVWLWLPASDDAALMSSDVAAVLPDDGRQVAVGSALFGPHGFRDSHQQAGRVKNAAIQAVGVTHRAMTFADVGPVAMLADDLQALRSWVRQVLGRLAVDGERESWLRDTLRVFLEADGSYAAAAERLQLHRNTVQYRVHQAEDVRGSPISAERMHVQLALTATRWLGSAVLTDDA